MLQARHPGPSDIQLGNDDYLGLLQNSKLVSSWERRRSAYHPGDVLISSAFITEGSFQSQVESRFAEFLSTDQSIICQSGWEANVGLIQAIATKKTKVYMDYLAHASFREGVKSAGASLLTFRHNDVKHAAQLIGNHWPGIVLVDAVYM